MDELSPDAVLLRRVPATPGFADVDDASGEIAFTTSVIRAGDLKAAGVSCYVEDLFTPEHSAANVATSDGSAAADDGTPGRHLVVAVTVAEVHALGCEVQLTPTEDSPIGYAHAEITYDGYLRAQDPKKNLKDTRQAVLDALKVVRGDASWVAHNAAKAR